MVDNFHDMEGRIMRLENKIGETIAEPDKKAMLMTISDPRTKELMGRLVQPSSVTYEQAKALIFQQLNIGDSGIANMVYHVNTDPGTPYMDALLQNNNTTPTTPTTTTAHNTETTSPNNAQWPCYNAAIPGTAGWVQPIVAPSTRITLH